MTTNTITPFHIVLKKLVENAEIKEHYLLDNKPTMKTIFKTKRWNIYFEKRGSLSNGNGWKEWSLTARKVCGNGDDGVNNEMVKGVIYMVK